MKIRWKELLVAIAIPLLVGGLSALLTSGSMQDFEQLIKPPLSPPGWLFPVVWTVLYILMGIASYLIYTAKHSAGLAGNALFFYALQLFFNFFWSVIFFNWEMYLLAFIWLIILWALIIITAVKFYRISKPAGYLMIPWGRSSSTPPSSPASASSCWPWLTTRSSPRSCPCGRSWTST